MIDPALFLDEHAQPLWDTEDREDMIRAATSMKNKQAPIVINAVDYDSNGFCDVSVEVHPWAITLMNVPALLDYLLDRASTPWLGR